MADANAMDARRYYEAVTTVYVRVFGHHWHLGLGGDQSDFHRAAERLTERMAGEVPLTSAMTVLDLGCGVCGPAAYLARTIGCRVIGVSNSESGLDEARRHLAAQGLADRVECRIADALALPLADASVDALWSCECIHNIADAPALARELARVVRAGGPVVIGSYFQRGTSAAATNAASRLRAFGFHLQTSAQLVADFGAAGIDLTERTVIDADAGYENLRGCSAACRAEAPRQPEGSLERTICERSADATALLADLYRAGDLGWAIWAGVRS